MDHDEIYDSDARALRLLVQHEDAKLLAERGPTTDRETWARLAALYGRAAADLMDVRRGVAAKHGRSGPFADLQAPAVRPAAPSTTRHYRGAPSPSVPVQPAPGVSMGDYSTGLMIGIAIGQADQQPDCPAAPETPAACDAPNGGFDGSGDF